MPTPLPTSPLTPAPTPAPTLNHPRQGDLTVEEREDLLVLLIAVRMELHDRRGSCARRTGVPTLLDADTSEIADDAQATVPRLHHLWCGTDRCFGLTIHDSDEEDSDEDDGVAALIRGTPCRYAVAAKCWALPKTTPRRRGDGQGSGRD